MKKPILQLINSALLIFNLFLVTAQAQTCDPFLEKTTPTGDFTVNNDGTVTHKNTRLMWKVCSEGQTWSAGTCNNPPSSITAHTWDSALQIASVNNAASGYANRTDWRLPNINELASLAELSCHSPVINEVVFPFTASSIYWSSSIVKNSSSSAWHVDFDFGGHTSNSRSNVYRVRLVRNK